MLSAQANAKFYADQITDTEIKSPVDGVIVSKALEVGEWVTPGVPILTVDDLSTIWARVDVEETDLGSLYVGKSAQVVLPTDPPQIFTGRVMAIGQEGEFATERDVRRGRQDIRTFYVKVQVLQADGELKPGMTAEVTFPRHTMEPDSLAIQTKDLTKRFGSFHRGRQGQLRGPSRRGLRTARSQRRRQDHAGADADHAAAAERRPRDRRGLRRRAASAPGAREHRRHPAGAHLGPRSHRMGECRYLRRVLRPVAPRAPRTRPAPARTWSG